MAETIIKRIAVSIMYDERGFVCFPFDIEVLQQGGYYNIHIPSMNPGAIRGNHFHREKEEYVFIMGKKCRVVVEDQATKTREELYCEDQPDSVLVLPAHVAHAIKNEGDEVVYLFCYNRREDGEQGRPETTRAVILE